jgi:hypothetical protein
VKQVFAVLACAAAFLLPAGIASASPDSTRAADPNQLRGGCDWKVCGRVFNESRAYVWAIRNWGDPSTKWKPLSPGDHTDRTQDWDGFFVPCNASGRIATWEPPGFWVWHDFSLPAGHTKQIHNWDDAHVRNQSC